MSKKAKFIKSVIPHFLPAPLRAPCSFSNSETQIDTPFDLPKLRSYQVFKDRAVHNYLQNRDFGNLNFKGDI